MRSEFVGKMMRRHHHPVSSLRLLNHDLPGNVRHWRVIKLIDSTIVWHKTTMNRSCQQHRQTSKRKTFSKHIIPTMHCLHYRNTTRPRDLYAHHPNTDIRLYVNDVNWTALIEFSLDKANGTLARKHHRKPVRTNHRHSRDANN